MPDETSLATEPKEIATFEEYLQVHETTDGWFSRAAATIWEALLSFQAAQDIRGHMLEIGVWHAKSAALMARHVDPDTELCFLVDLFLNEQEIETTLNRVLPSIGENVRAVRCDSRELKSAPLLQDASGKFRWIHIDGEHTAGAVSNDLEIAATLLSKQGLVVVDDFLSWLYPQITEAVFRYLRDHPDHFAMVLCGYNKAYLAHPHFAHVYHDFCHANLIDEMEANGAESLLAKTTFPSELSGFSVGPRIENTRLRGPDWDQGRVRY